MLFESRAVSRAGTLEMIEHDYFEENHRFEPVSGPDDEFLGKSTWSDRVRSAAYGYAT